MRCILTVALFVSLTPVVFADRAHDLAAQAADQSPDHCPNGLKKSATCHDNHPTGCSMAASPSYDAYLNFLKNQIPDRDLAADRFVFDGDFPDLESSVPDGIGSRNHADFAADFAKLGEGNIVAVIGFLYFVQDTGADVQAHPSRKGETCNCQLRAADSFDYHLGIGFDPLLASRIGQPSEPSLTTLQQTSIVAEMTPHTRPASWSFDRVERLRGKQVKVVGQLLFDNMHASPSADCGWPKAKKTCWRGSAWELHPIIQFYVCANAGGCDENSPATDWSKLDDLP